MCFPPCMYNPKAVQNFTKYFLQTLSMYQPQNYIHSSLLFAQYIDEKSGNQLISLVHFYCMYIDEKSNLYPQLTYIVTVYIEEKVASNIHNTLHITFFILTQKVVEVTSHSVEILYNFSITQILSEINFGDSKSAKSAFLQIQRI